MRPIRPPGIWATTCLILLSTPCLNAQPEPAHSFLLIDLEADGLYLAELAYAVSFDIDGDGRRERMSWTATGRNEAFLWLDHNANGIVDDGNELLRTVSDLARLDQPELGGNADGFVSRRDARWSELLLWIDRSHDAVSSPSEISTPAQWRIRRIGLAFRQVLLLDGSGNLIQAVSSDGRVRQVLFAEQAP